MDDRERLIAQCVPIVRSNARQIAQKWAWPIEDALSDGYVGMLEAIERYDPDSNVPFGAYARFRIRGAIIDGVRRMRRYDPTTEQFSSESPRHLGAIARTPARPDVLFLRTMQRAIDALPGEHRRVLEMSIFDGRTNRDIAKALSVHEVRVSLLITEAKTRLRNFAKFYNIEA
jgi:RNA polymerase sigma factor (sigma-70 family)